MDQSQTKKEVLEILENLPGATRGVIRDLMPHVPKQTVGWIIAGFLKDGTITGGAKVPSKRGPPSSSYTLNPNPTPRAEPKLKLVATNLNLDELTELRAWKIAAIARYPDLGVDPVILAARKLVARKYTNGDAAAIERGLWDSKPIMQVTIEALEMDWAA